MLTHHLLYINVIATCLAAVLWIPEYFKARGAGQASLYAETFAVAAANLPGDVKKAQHSTDPCVVWLWAA